ncbi:MAG: phosphonate C-P lyase system protein PhnL [Alphaproteobacteria bacterium]|nr:phosphonate C-P lyase system protein PhnL [Alphaproteobacteria bacterium]
MSEPMIRVETLGKTFTLHTQDGIRIPVFDDLSFDVVAGECLALYGASGCGKSTLLRSLYANYKPQSGRVLVRHDGGWIDMTAAEPRQVMAVRRRTIGYVSQFLRVIPRVPTLEIVAEPLLALGADREGAETKARDFLTRLRIPERLWGLAPATFSGGEQQRVNIARGFIVDYPVLLLDEPTAALDSANRQSIIGLIDAAKERGAAIVGIFHDDEVRTAVADRILDIEVMKKVA